MICLLGRIADTGTSGNVLTVSRRGAAVRASARHALLKPIVAAAQPLEKQPH